MFLLIQIIFIIIGIIFLAMAFSLLRARKQEQERVQDQFSLYLVIGLVLIFFPFVLEYLGLIINNH